MNAYRTTPTGTLRINSSVIGEQQVIAPLVARFLDAHPGIHLEIADNDGLIDVVGAGFDAGLRFQDSVPEDMVAIPIGGALRWAVVGSPDYFKGRASPLHPHDLLQHDCIRIRFPSGRLFKWEFECGETLIELEVRGRLTVGDHHVAVRAALDGAGLAIVFEDVVAEQIADGRLVRVLDDWCPSFEGFMLYYPRQRRMSSALRAFIDMMADP